MNEMMFGSGSPMWTAIPSVGLAYQPIGFGTRAPNTPVYGSALVAGGIGAGPGGAQSLSTPAPLPTPMYGYGPTGPQQNLSGGFAGSYPFAVNPSGALIGPDATGLVTASSLLASVAMRRGQPQGPINDQEVEEFIYDALDLLPGAADVEVRCESGRAMLTGSVQQKRTKRDVGELAWAIPGLHDVQNNVSIVSRRRGRAAGRDAETPAAVSARKQA